MSSEKGNAPAATEADQGKQQRVAEIIAQKLGDNAPPAIDASVLAPITSRVRTDITATKGANGPYWTKEPLTAQSLDAHINGNVPRGCCPIKAGESVTRLALFDFDSHKGETPWPEMQKVAIAVMDKLEGIAMRPIAFRSSGGRGIHLFMLWDAPQDAYSVRKFLAGVLASMGYKNGTGGVAASEIEIFPKQDSVPPNGHGNMFILPLAGKSEPLEELVGLEPMGKEWASRMEWPLSAPVPFVEKPIRAPAALPTGADAAMACRALMAIPNTGNRDWWLKLVFAVKEAAGDGGYGTCLEWSALHPTYDEAKFDKAWNSVTIGKHNGVPAEYLFRVAHEHGFTEHLADEFEAVVLSPEEDAEQAAIRAGNLEKMRRQSEKGRAQAIESEISFVDFASLAFGAPPPRQWIVQEWIPRGSVTALFGRGGHGKSLLAQQMGVAVANGLEFLEVPTTAGPVLGLFCEDDNDEMLRRGSDLFDAAGLMSPGECSGQLFLDARAGKFNTLISFSPDRLAAPTLLMAELRKQCEITNPALVILDNIAQLFAGQENVRSEVTSFCNELTGIARAFNCAVLLLGHTAKMEGSEYSGSTAWDAAVRSRLFLERQEDGTSVLKKSKANYSALEELRLEYRNGAFFPLSMGSQTSPEVLEAIKPIIVAAISKYTARLQSASHLPTARNYLIKQMKSDQLLGGVSERIAHAALGAMIDDGAIKPNAILPWKSPSRHPVQGLVVAK